MKTFAGIIVVWVIIFEILAFTAFHYNKSVGWWVANIILIIGNFFGLLVVENNAETPPPTWKVYLPIILMIALMVLIVLPQASKFNA